MYLELGRRSDQIFKKSKVKVIVKKCASVIMAEAYISMMWSAASRFTMCSLKESEQAGTSINIVIDLEEYSMADKETTTRLNYR